MSSVAEEVQKRHVRDQQKRKNGFAVSLLLLCVSVRFCPLQGRLPMHWQSLLVDLSASDYDCWQCSPSSEQSPRDSARCKVACQCICIAFCRTFPRPIKTAGNAPRVPNKSLIHIQRSRRPLMATLCFFEILPPVESLANALAKPFQRPFCDSPFRHRL